ncbi:adenine phosphoribosyltransferase [Candidatus Arthromitus sp. SFB-mouse-Japan]|uniref:adenine phosphoribosyltransferase n=1 Tax=unclassified Candidatus Neoarthromitus TaxID=2638829 RepID=UPI00021B7E1E|nr:MULTISPECIES: adenine phosphoribosyltransferase [unclassified Candidatus Arthromitus]EIA22353.1 Putative adenine phosphoribosyltransferase [Candidatus Arthromitus sp. SFB-1]EIA24898.1 Putative adenine phosphoribosyltransferase [Candidatus Arthromitus sp. SFB-2]EIA26346.1 Putative adenine phosphoribosyltransferase [Candidatus Arthromitus sp. SFB-3]EIA27607.1 Putative adenine phosphoribosyltransferase [Candidatus Arthromitus sp. SFB-4]EIA28285.1 phosphoribosyltransferase [Candidatus Arthromit
MDLKESIRIIEDFPKKGISFKDITTIIQDGKIFRYVIDLMVSNLKDKKIDLIVAPEARGFIFGIPVAYALGIGFVPVRKKGKLPGDTIGVSYDLEYGKDTLEMHKDALKNNPRVAIIDDLLATGGTIKAVAELVEKAGGEVVELDFVIELEKIGGRDILKGYNVHSFVKYDV